MTTMYINFVFYDDKSAKQQVFYTNLINMLVSLDEVDGEFAKRRCGGIAERDGNSAGSSAAASGTSSAASVVRMDA